MRRHIRSVSTFAILIAGSILAQTQTFVDSALQGSWTVIGAQHGGKPMDGLNGGVMTVTRDRFEIHTASGNLLKGELHLDKTRNPAQMDLRHDDGTRWEAVYQVDGDDFKLNYVAAGGKDKRPATFKTSPDSEASVVILKRRKD